MTTDSFIQALTRLTARRGNVRQIHSNNEPNFVGVDQELINAFNEMDHTKIQEVLQNNSADWIKQKRKPNHDTWVVYWSAKFVQPEVY